MNHSDQVETSQALGVSTENEDAFPHLRQPYATCPLCGGVHQQVKTVDCTWHPMWSDGLPNSLVWLQCGVCKHVFTSHFWTDDGLKVVFSKSNAYQQAGSTANLDAKRAVWTPVVDRALRALGGYSAAIGGSKDSYWVDVGCGDGALTMTAHDYGFFSVGLDARKETVDLLSSMGFMAFQGQFMSTVFKKPLTVLSMMDVLEHMPYPRLALEKASKIIRPGGLIVISLPDTSSSTWTVLDIKNANPYWAEIEHHHNFSRASLSSLLTACGFSVVDFAIPTRYKAQMEIYAIRN